jgi:hypothetical protein
MYSGKRQRPIGNNPLATFQGIDNLQAEQLISAPFAEDVLNITEYNLKLLLNALW